MIKKGQNLRLFMAESEDGSTKCFAAAQDCSYHIAAQLEESTSKDSTGDFIEQEVVGKSWDCQTNALVVIDNTETALLAFEVADLVGKKVKVEFTETNGEQNRDQVAKAPKLSGIAIVSDFSLTATNKQKATYSIQLQGTGKLTVTQAQS